MVQVSASANLPVVWSSPQPVRPAEMAKDEAFTMEAYGVDYGFVGCSRDKYQGRPKFLS